MARDGAATRRHIIDAAYALFYKRGFARAGVDAIAAAAGVTKRTFYYHFDSKDTLVAEVLGAQHELMLMHIGQWFDRARGDPFSMTEILFSDFATWAREPRWQGSGFTRVAMELAGSPGHPGRAAARRHKAAVERLFAEKLALDGVSDAAKLARQLVLLIEGCNSLVLIHGDTAYAEAARDAARCLVRQHLDARPVPQKHAMLSPRPKIARFVPRSART